MNTTQDDHYATAQDTASVIRPITADEAWLHAQLDRLDPHRLEAGGAGDTPALIKLVFELRVDAGRYRFIRLRTGASYGARSGQEFTIPRIDRLIGQDLMRGSVAQHFDAAIDAAMKETP
jgi:hypothetical protein